MDALRLIGAGIFFFGGVFASVALLIHLFGPDPSAWLVVPWTLIAFLFVLAATVTLFSIRGASLIRRLNAAKDRTVDLEAAGLVVDERFEARRAFQVDEAEDEGLSFFIELTDGSVLFLMGQYLYGLDEPRRFPCTRFTIRRHRLERYVIDLICEGETIEPEVVAPPFGDADVDNDRVPQDGDVIRDRSFDEIKEERTR